jgi:hypothetical protein
MMQAAQLFSSLTGVQERFATAWMAAENGYQWDSATNNPANISWSGKGIPSGGVFKGVVRVLPNAVCVYVDWQSGVRAWALELNIPKSQTKWLTIDTRDLLSCTSIENMARVVGQSNWAGVAGRVYLRSVHIDNIGRLVWQRRNEDDRPHASHYAATSTGYGPCNPFGLESGGCRTPEVRRADNE